ncbi:M56 family metallopeptidase, partial [Symmachiella dynata]|uniref:M56 family metallopeptidase n=1 Tax=Symmachiella dynata TaxID=2527995 RepID=UPI0030ED509C
MTRAWSEFFIEMPLLWDLCLRLSVVLIIAWGLHAALTRCNPRWRVHLWRFTSIAVLIVMAATCLPKTAVLVEQQVAAVELVVEEPSLVTMSQPMLRGAGTVADVSKLPPINPETEFPLESFLPEEEVATTAVAIPAEPPQSTATSPWAMWLLASVWAVGTSLLAVRWMAAQLRIRNLLSRTIPAPKQSVRLLRRVADRLDIFGDFDLRLSNETDVPFVAGLWRPIVVLPARMAEQRFAPELPAIFAHELTHVKSRDLIWMGVSQWITIPLWFHPLTWRATSAHSMACEEVADAVAAENVGDVARYSGTLARVALAAVSHPPATAAISMARSSQIMSRLARLKRGLSNTPL